MAEEHNLEVNVEQIMEEIRERIRREEKMEEIPAFESIPIKEEVPAVEQNTQSDLSKIEGSLQYINANYDIPYYWSFGPAGVKTFLKRVVRKLAKCLIPPILEKQNHFNAHVVNCLNTVKGLFIRIDERDSEIDHLKNSISEQLAAIDEVHSIIVRQEKIGQTQQVAVGVLEEKVQKQQETIEGLEGGIQAQRAAIEDLEGVIQAQRAAIEDLEGVIQAQRAALEHLEGTVQLLQRKIELLDRQSDSFSASVAKTILAYKRDNNLPVDKPAPKSIQSVNSLSEKDAYTALNYFKFQNHFRGSRSLIMERQTIYLPYFGKSTEPVLDIGCGRGEFLHLLKEANIPAFGVDLYPEYVVEGELHGLDIRQGDGIAFLKETDMQFGGIFAAQLIEHISFTQLQELCLAAYEKLVPDGSLILETPNPTCLAVYTNAFYIDPTHQRPVHPALLTYLLQETGFREVQVLYTKASQTGERLPKITGEGILNLEEINQAIEQVSELLYGSQDYAVIAKK